MKKLLLIFISLLFSIGLFAQTGTGWSQQRAKINFRDSINLAKGWIIDGTVVLPSVTEINYLDGVSSALQSQINGKLSLTDTSNMLAPYIQRVDTASMLTKYARKASPTFTGTVTLPSGTSIGDVSSTEIGYVNNVTSAIQTQLTARQYFHYDYIIEEVAGTTYARPNPNSAYTAYSNAVPSVPINSAIQQLTSGGVIWFKEGTFDNCDSIVVDKNNIIFQGSGQRKTILKLKASFDAAKKFSDGFIQVTGTDVTIRDLEIDGNAANQTKIDHGTSDAVAIINGIESEDAHRLVIDNVYIHDFTETCIFATGCDYGKILNSTIEDGFWNGITLGWGTQHWVVDKCIVQGSTPVLGDSSSIGDVGIALYGRYHRVTNNLIKNIVGARGYDNSRAGISLEFSSDGTDLNEAARPAGMFISNNRFEGSGMTSGVANNGLGSGSKSCIITNNYFDSCKYAINFWGDSAKITDNKIYAYQIGSYTYGIYIQEGDYNFVSTNEVIVPTTGSGNYPILIVENGSDGANYNTVTNNTLIGGTYYSIGVSGSNCTGNEIIGNILDDDSAGDYDIYDTGTGTIKKGNYDRQTARWTPDPSLNVGIVGSANDVTIDSIRYLNAKLAFYDGATTVDPLIKDTINLSSVVPLLNDTIPLFVFGGGGGNDGDSTVFTTSTVYGSFFNAGSDTLVITELRAVMATGSKALGNDTLDINVYWHSTFLSGSATKLNTTDLPINSITTGTTDTSFNNAKIPPGVFVWCKSPAVILGRKPEMLVVQISGYKIPTY